MSSNKNIISGPSPDYIFDTKGLGYELFQSMVKYAEGVAQIDAKTGNIQTFNSLLRRCVQTAIALQNIGIQPGDTISICTYNHMDTCVPIVASTFIGSIMASLDVGLPKEDMRALLINFDAKVIFVSPEAEGILESILKELTLKPILVVFGDTENNLSFETFLAEYKDDFKVFETEDSSETILITCTGGTSGFHKGVCLSHNCMVYNCQHFPVTLKKGGVTLTYSPMIWWLGPHITLACIINGCSKVVASQIDYVGMWDLIEKFKVNYAIIGSGQAVTISKCGVPKEKNLSSLEFLVFGGGCVPKDILYKLHVLLPHVFLAYGLGNTEAGGIITALSWTKDSPEMKGKIGSVGYLRGPFTAKIVDINTEEALGPNKPGEFRIKSKCKFNGYKGLSSADVWDSDGYFKTGDICYYDEDGLLYYVDRMKDMIRYRTWAVSPLYFEHILLEHPAVRIAFVTGVPHAEDGDHAVGIVVLKEGYHATAEEIEKFVIERQTDGRCLKAGIIIVDLSFVPFAISGKIKRYEFRRKILDKYFNDYK